MTSKLSGALFRKAMIEDDFEKVYEKVFIEISTKVFEDDVHILEIFGNVGG